MFLWCHIWMYAAVFQVTSNQQPDIFHLTTSWLTATEQSTESEIWRDLRPYFKVKQQVQAVG